jgi:hypothetical protein
MPGFAALLDPEFPETYPATNVERDKSNGQ